MKKTTEVEASPAQVIEDANDLAMNLAKLKKEASDLPARKRAALEAGDAEAYNLACEREQQIPNEIRFTDLRLLRSRREMLAKLQEVANSKVADINNLLGSLIERRDEIWQRTEDERRAIEHQRASAFSERDSAYSDAERYRREISELGDQIEQLLRASA